ncbi:Hypothetical predicted protein [Mytilus galloprovincialis]|uniref:Uncharacterized protein n=1 Tax=Mytilus galloprovincialis TaxID=29158 RepID=A0A8B6DV56_MYTGA|nr:Hypothetical predicted protein [Mytilus galloprovincialis]
MCLNELARMHAQIGEGDLASRFYRMASDAAQEKSRDFLTGNQISGQSMMLVANLNDQAILGEEKASRSRGYWQSVLSSPEYHKESIVNEQSLKLCYVTMVTGGQLDSNLWQWLIQEETRYTCTCICTIHDSL